MKKNILLSTLIILESGGVERVTFVAFNYYIKNGGFTEKLKKIAIIMSYPKIKFQMHK